MKYNIINKCQICKGVLIRFLNLKNQPLCDDITNKPYKSNFYKLEVLYCKKCLTAFQKYNIKKKFLFPKNYHYRSSNTKDVLDGMKNLVKNTKKYIKNLKGKSVLDIGCNDGSLLDLFKKKGCKTFGIEPTDAAKEARKKGHYILNSYFNFNISKKIIQKIKNIDIITFTNVFAHIEDFKSLIKSLKHVTSQKTLIIIENHYFSEVIKKNQFDTFYHEHPRTYSLKSFVEIAKLLELKLIDYEFVQRYNGNIRVYLQKKGVIHKTPQILIKDLKQEKKILSNIKNFQNKVNYWIINKKKLIKKIVNKNGPVPAKAFPGRASILINLLKLNSKHISNIYEKNNSMKVNKYVPGTDIKIKKEKLFSNSEKKKNIIINMAWHISDEIKNYLRKNMKFKGKIVDILSQSDFK